MNPFVDPVVSLRWVTTVASFGVLISTLELLSMRRQLASGGLFDWELMKRLVDRPAAVARVLDPVFGYPQILFVLGARILAAGVLVAGAEQAWCLVGGLTVVYLTNLLLLDPRRQFTTGADDMVKVVFAALFLGQVVGSDALAARAALGVIALQSCIAYAGNGFAKLREPSWRAGEIVADVAGHNLFGSRPAARLLRRHPLAGRLLTWGTVTMECLFPLVLVVGAPACWIFLSWGAAFHLVSAYCMGLNRFFWIFLATYPAILYAVEQVERFLA